MQVLHDIKSEETVSRGIGVTGADEHLSTERPQESGSPLYQRFAIGREQSFVAAKATAVAPGKDATRQFQPSLWCFVTHARKSYATTRVSAKATTNAGTASRASRSDQEERTSLRGSIEKSIEMTVVMAPSKRI